MTSSFPRWPGDSTAPFILHLAQDFQELGWQVDVLAPHAPGALRSENMDGVHVERFRYLWPESAQTVCYNGGALLNLRSDKANILKVPALVAFETAKIMQKLSSRQFDLVHSHWIVPQGLAAGAVARTLQIPHVATVHGSDVFALRGRVLTAFKRLAIQLSDTVTVNSVATRKVVQRIGHGDVPVLTIPMGAGVPLESDHAEVSNARARFRQGPGPLVIFVGRLIEQKGVADFLTALSILRGSLPSTTALIVGEGPHRAIFEEQARQLGISEIVHFTGWVSSREVGVLLRASDAFVAPSKQSPDGSAEAQGISIVEAMLTGVPVIASHSGGIVDMVRDRETGLLVPEAAPQAIAAAIRELQGNHELRSHLVEKAHALAARDYTRTVCAQKFSDLFDKMVRP